MSRALTFVYAFILLFLAVDSLWLGSIFPAAFLPYAVMLMGVAILLTKIVSPQRVNGQYAMSPRPAYQWLRRYILGLALVFIGLTSTGVLGDFGDLLNVTTAGGGLVLLAISVIYFLACFAKTRGIEMNSL